MKKIGRFIYFTTLFLLIAGCKQQKSIRYELVDGNPQIDYIDFLKTRYADLSHQDHWF